MFTIVALESLGTKKATWRFKAHAATLNEAVVTALDYAEYLGISADERLVRSTMERYGKYRHFQSYSRKAWGRDAVIIIPGRH